MGLGCVWLVKHFFATTACVRSVYLFVCMTAFMFICLCECVFAYVNANVYAYIYICLYDYSFYIKIFFSVARDLVAINSTVQMLIS